MLQHEAIELAYALTMEAADRVGARALAIKGLVSSFHGLRPARTPADVDILVEPDGFPAFARQLQTWGWRIRLGEFTDFPVPHHSVTYIHDQWPCDIDAHHRFPGFLAPPGEVFDTLWERHHLLPAAGRMIPMTDWTGSATITALHSVRSTPDNPRHSDELHKLLDLAPTWTQAHRSDLATLALATGCVQSLEAIWPRL
ncbi:MAG: nucleotidyltransferase family protein, partial [Propionibacteriaceae bacterium]|nr:nucleotidyltransferase family protein [Propionibacteriaceae bacterium]